MHWWRLRRLRKQLRSRDYSSFNKRKLAAIQLGQWRDAGSVDILMAALTPSMGQWLPEAAAALGNIGDARAVEALLPLLDPPNPQGMREAVADALAKIGDERAIRPLVRTLHLLPDTATRALLKFGNVAVPLLVEELSTRDLARRRAAGGVLQKLGWRPDKDVDRLAYAIAVEDWEVAVGMGAAAVNSLYEESVRLRFDESPAKAGVVLDAIAKIRDVAAVGPLLKVARSNSSGPVADALCAALVGIGDVAVEQLIVLLCDGVPVVRSFAARVLAELPATHAVVPLTALLTDEFPDVRLAVATALDRLGWHPTDDRQRVLRAIALQHWDIAVAVGSAALNPLRETISVARAHTDFKIALSAMTAAIHIGGPEAIGVLVDTLQHRDAQVRRQAAKMLASLYWEPPDDTQRAWLAVAMEDFDRAAQYGLVGLEPLIAMLHDPDWNVRERAVTAVASIGGDRAIAELGWVTKNDPYSHFAYKPMVAEGYESEASFPVQEAAATALKQIKAKQSQVMPGGKPSPDAA